MKNFLKFFLLILSSGVLLTSGVSYAAVEDFTTYTETDPNNILSVAANAITITGIARNSGAYVSKDAGAGHFTTAFSYLVSAQVDSYSGDAFNSTLHIWSLSNSSAPALTDDPIVTLYAQASAASPAGNLSYTLMVDEGTADTNDSFAAGPGGWGTQYWFIITRSGTAITAKVYSDAARTTLVDTLTVTGSASQTYQYVVAAHSRGGSGGTGNMSGSLSGLDLQEPATATTLPAGSDDHTPPARYNAHPMGILAESVTQTKISLITDEPAVCRYSSSPFTPYDLMPSIFSTTEVLGKITHFSAVAGLISGNSYAYYAKCSDGRGNVTPDDFLIYFNVAADTSPPVRSSGYPAGVLDAGVSQTDVSLVTDEPAICRYSTTAGTAYGLMPNTFWTTGGASHSAPVTGLAGGNTYTYYIKCSDAGGRFNTDDFIISFSVTPSPNLFVTLLASPSFGQAPLYGVDLTAIVSGTAIDTINYIFYCNRSDSGVNITPGYSVRYNSIGFVSQEADDACNYLSPGTYYPKVIVERGGLAAEAKAEITVAEYVSGKIVPKASAKEEIQAKIIEIQQKIIELVKQLIQLMQTQTAGIAEIFLRIIKVLK